ncbi:MAG TPA: 2-hydroxyacid dehydrogenase [Candidatus Cybelea sp.]|nr:2-hydroxyacid dehydrogenase [Candidatus Cybelea sp.]
MSPTERPEILVLAKILPAALEALSAQYRCHFAWEATDQKALLADIGPRVRALVIGGTSAVPAALIDALPKLEIIAVFGVGYDKVDLDRCRARGVALTNTPEVLTDDVADLALGLMLAVSRRIVFNDRFAREGRWLSGNPPLARKLSGKRLGILGLGRIGKAVARRAAGFGMSIAYHDVAAQTDQPWRFVPDLVELARGSDFLAVTAAASAGTDRMVNRAVLDALGKKGTLISVARGSIVDEAALVAALTEGRLGAAGLDVFIDEPRIPEALFKLDNVVLQPHQASATLETRQAMADLVLSNLAAHFAGKALLTRVL